MLERHELRVFLAVVEASGFSRAAERLSLSQSAVSQAVANLEHKLGTQLLKRGSPPKLTEAGVRVLRFAETMAKAELETLQDVEQIRAGARSTLSLALSSAVNHRFGMELLRDFSERNPLTRLKVAVVPSREIVLGVGEGRWELGFGPFLHQMPGHYALVDCFTEVRQLVVGKGHPELPRFLTQPLQMLPETPLLTSYLEDSPGRAEPHGRTNGERLRNAFGAVWEITHLDLRLQLAAEGKGVTYVSHLILEDRDDLVPVEGVPFAQIERRVGVFYLRDQPLSQAANRFIARCRVRWPVDVG